MATSRAHHCPFFERPERGIRHGESGRAVVLAALLIVATNLSGCSLNPELHVLNRTQKELTFKAGSREQRLKPGEEVVLVYAEPLAVVVDAVVHRYDFSERAQGFVRVGAPRVHLRLQLEPDLRLHFLELPKQMPIDLQRNDQPNGVPLSPR